jgi:hypothetical protein
MEKRLAWLAKERGDTPPTKETRQNYRAALRKARKMYPRKVKA